MQWFVSAKRNKTTVKIPATHSISLGVPATDQQQSDECDRMVASLEKHGWVVQGIEAY